MGDYNNQAGSYMGKTVHFERKWGSFPIILIQRIIEMTRSQKGRCTDTYVHYQFISTILQ